MSEFVALLASFIAQLCISVLQLQQFLTLIGDLRCEIFELLL